MLKVLIISFLFLKIIKLHKKQKLFTLLGHILIQVHNQLQTLQ